MPDEVLCLQPEVIYSTEVWMKRGANPYLISIVTGSQPGQVSKLAHVCS